MRLFIAFLCSLAAFLPAKNVYIVPIGHHTIERLFFDPYGYRDECARPFFALREALEKEGFTVKYTWDGKGLEDVAAVISLIQEEPSLLNNISAQCPREKCILCIFESPLIQPSVYREDLKNYFGKIFIMSDDRVDGQTYQKLYYPQPRLYMDNNLPDFNQKKFCALMAGNKDSQHPLSLYPERKKVIQLFPRMGAQDFDLYGPDWKGYSCWKGYAESKWAVLKNYKFSICFENFQERGYITEKIFDSLVAGCVPVYWGAPNITDFIPKECFIDRRDFHSHQQLYYHLKSMKQETYERYITAIRKFLAGPQAQLFSIDHFVKQVVDEVKKCQN